MSINLQKVSTAFILVLYIHMCVYMYVCVCIYVFCVCMHTQTQTWIHTYSYVLSWPKCSFGVFCKVLQKNANNFLANQILACYGCAQPASLQPTDCSAPGSSAHGIIPARIQEQVAISSSRGSSRPRNRTHASCIFHIGRQILYHCATWEALISTLR